jgi:hypothetical protein
LKRNMLLFQHFPARSRDWSLRLEAIDLQPRSFPNTGPG